MGEINKVENSRNYYVITAAALLLTTSVAFTVLIGLNHWQLVQLRQNFSKFLSKNLALRASMVALVGTTALIMPFGIAYALTHKRDHLKSRFLSDSASKELKAIVDHNQSLFSTMKAVVNEEHLEAIAKMIIDDPKADPLKVIERLSKLNLNFFITEDLPTDEAKYYLDVTGKKVGNSLSVSGSRALGGVVAVIGNIIGAVGIADLFKSSEDDMQASLKAQKILMLVSLLNILLTLLVPTLGARMAGIVVGSSVGGLTLLSLLWPRIMPIPPQLPGNGVNLTEEAIAGNIPNSDARQDVSDQLYQTLKSGKHALLIGPSRTGKTMALRSFVEKVARGVYPELKGKVAWYWNTADLAQSTSSSLIGGTNNPLAKIAKNVGTHNMGGVIFCFDEMHSALVDNKDLPEQMKTAFDEGGAFQHVIGITTTSEYEEHIKKNTALDRRFVKIEVGNMNQVSSVRVLSDLALQNPSMPLLEKDVLSHLVKQSTNQNNLGSTPQPFTARDKLAKAIIQLDANDEMTPLQNSVAEKENQISALLAEAITSGSQISGTQKDQVDRLRNELRDIKDQLAIKQGIKDKVDRARRLLCRVRNAKYQSVLKEKKVQYTLLQRLEARLVEEIKERSQKVGLQAELTTTVVDQILSS